MPETITLTELQILIGGDWRKLEADMAAAESASRASASRIGDVLSGTGKAASTAGAEIESGMTKGTAATKAVKVATDEAAESARRMSVVERALGGDIQSAATRVAGLTEETVRWGKASTTGSRDSQAAINTYGKAQVEAADAGKRLTSQTTALIAEQKAFNKVLTETELKLQAISRTPMQKWENFASGGGLDRDVRLAQLQNKYPGMRGGDLAQQVEVEQQIKQIEARKQLIGTAGTGVANVAAGITGLGALAAFDFGKFDHEMVLLRANTKMADDEFETMKRTALDLAATTGTSAVKLGEAYMQASIYGFKAAGAINVVSEANKLARGTGADAVVTTKILGRTLNELGLDGSHAAEVVNLLYVAAQGSGSKLNEFAEGGQRAFAMAAVLGQRVETTSAALSILSQRLPMHDAQTQFINMLNRISGPVPGVRAKIEELSYSLTSIGRADLAKTLKDDFTLAGLSVKQFSGVVKDAREVADALGMPYNKLAKDLLPGLRGEIGFLIGTSDTGFKGLEERMKAARDVMAGSRPANEAFVREQATAIAHIDQLAQRIQVKFMPAGEKFIDLFMRAEPVLETGVDVLVKLLDAFTKLPGPVQEVVLAFGAGRLLGAVLGLNGPMGRLGGFIGRIAKELLLVPGAAKAAQGGLLTLTEGGGLSLLGKVGAGVGAGALFLTAAQPAGIGGDLGPSKDAQENIKRAEEQLANAKKRLAEFQSLKDADARLDFVTKKFGSNLFGGPMVGRDDYWSQLRAEITGAERRIGELQGQSHNVAASPGSQAAAGSSKGDNSDAMLAKARAAMDEHEKFAGMLQNEQAKLNEAMAGGNKEAQAFAKSLIGLTDEHKKQILAVHEHTIAINKAAEERKKQEAIEKRFSDQMTALSGSLKEARDGEGNGLAKLAKEYPGVTEARLRDMLAVTQHIAEVKKEHELNDKLTQALTNLKSEFDATTAKTDVHRVAVELTGKSYDQLTSSQQASVTAIAALKRQMADTKVLDEWKKKVSDGVDKIGLLAGPKSVREAVGFVGGLDNWKKLTPEMQKVAIEQTQLAEQANRVATAFDRMATHAGGYGGAIQELQLKISGLHREIQRGLLEQAKIETGMAGAREGGTFNLADVQSAQALSKSIEQGLTAAERTAAYNKYQDFVGSFKGLGEYLNLANQLPDVKAQVEKNRVDLKATQASLKADLTLLNTYAVDSGKGMIDGLITGLGDPTKLTELKAAASAMGTAAAQAARAALEIKSPSGVFHRIGKDTAQGFIDGMDSKHGDIASSMKMGGDLAAQGFIDGLGGSMAGGRESFKPHHTGWGGGMSQSADGSWHQQGYDAFLGGAETSGDIQTAGNVFKNKLDDIIKFGTADQIKNAEHQRSALEAYANAVVNAEHENDYGMDPMFAPGLRAWMMEKDRKIYASGVANDVIVHGRRISAADYGYRSQQGGEPQQAQQKQEGAVSHAVKGLVYPNAAKAQMAWATAVVNANVTQHNSGPGIRSSADAGGRITVNVTQHNSGPIMHEADENRLSGKIVSDIERSLRFASS